MLGHDVKAGDGVNAALDLKLLGQLRRIAERAGTSVVIHGGSSIRSEDLRQLHRHGVARVDFGSQPFFRFLAAVAALLDETTITLPQTPGYAQRHLAERAANWQGVAPGAAAGSRVAG